MSNRMSLEEAKMELSRRGFHTIGNSRKGYRVWKDAVDHTTLVTGRGVVKFAKEVLLKEYEENHQDPEILAEMRATWEPGTKVINVLTGEETII